MRHVLKLLIIVVSVFLIGYFPQEAIDVSATYIQYPYEDYLDILSELLSVFVSFSIFTVTWHAYGKSKDNHSLFLGATFLVVGFLILFHTFSYPFMPNFITSNSKHKAISFFIESRVILAILFLTSVYIYKDTLPKLIKKNVLLLLTIVLSIISLTFVLLYPDYLFGGSGPDTGYNAAMIFLLSVITVVISYASYLYVRRFKRTGQKNLIFLIYGSVIIIFSNIVYLSYELSGHFLIIAGFFFIYIALYKSSVDLPYEKLAEAEEKLRYASEEKYRNLFDNANDAIITTDPEDRITSWNRSAEKIFGWGAQEIIGRKLSPLIVPDDLQEKREQFVRNALTGTGVIGIETVGLHKDGSRIDVSLTISPILNTDRKIRGLSEIFRDIRERKQIEAEKDKLLKAFASSTDGITIADENDRFIYVNEAYAKIFGYCQEELIGNTWRKITPPEVIAPTEKGLSSTMHNKDVGIFYGEVPGLRKDGTIIPTEVRGKGIWDENGSYQGHICIVRDITARKQVEEKLLLFRNLIDRSNDAIFVSEPETGHILDANDRACISLGYKREKLLNMRVSDLEVNLPDQFSWKEHVKEVRNRVHVLLEGQLRHQNGTAFPVEVNVSYIVLGKIGYMVAVARDITERKQAEETLRRKEEHFRSLIENALDTITILNRDGTISYESPSVQRVLGYKPEELIGKNAFELIHPEDLPSVMSTISRGAQNPGSTQSIEYRFRHKDGSWRVIESIGRRMTGNPESTGIIVNSRDITERKRAEEAWQTSEKKYSTLVEKGNDGIIIIRDGLLEFINSKMADIGGYTVKEIIGKPFYDFVSPEFKELTISNYRKRLSGEEAPNRYEIEIVSKGGRNIPVEVNASLIDYEGKRAEMAIIRDITEHKRAEEQIMQSLKEKEMLLREIHHRIKNNMQIVSSLLWLQSESIKEKEYFDMFKDAHSRVISMSLIHEKLYRSKDIAKIDFNEYIRDLANSLFRSYGLKSGKIALNVDAENVSLGVDLAIPCGLIINELITNSLKHAFPDGGEGEIKISLRPKDGNMVELIIGDNGIGIPSDVDFRRTESLGLRLVLILAEDQLHGKIDLDRSKGTEFKIIFKGVK